MFFGYSVRSPHRTTKPSWGCDAQAELMRFAAFLAHKCPRLKVIPKKVNLDVGCDQAPDFLPHLRRPASPVVLGRPKHPELARYTTKKRAGVRCSS